MVDWGELRVAFDHLAQHGRWLAWGPLRRWQNLSGYVRVPEEDLFVEIFCDVEQLEPDHEPRSGRTTRTRRMSGASCPRSYFRFDAEAIESSGWVSRPRESR